MADMTFPPPGVDPAPAIVVLDLESGEARRVLEGAAPLMPSERDVVIEGSLVGTTLESGEPHGWHLGVNPIAIDPAFDWVYFATIGGDTVYRIPADALANPAHDDVALGAVVEAYGPKPPCDGIAVDGEGRVFITDIEGSAVGVTTPGNYEVIAQDDQELSWPDGFALDATGALWVTQNQLHRHPALNEGADESTGAYRILRLRP